MIKLRSVALLASALAGTSVILAGCGTSTSPSAPTSAKAPASIGNAAVVGLPAQVSLNWFFPIMPATAYSVYNNQTEFNMYVPLISVTSQDKLDYSRSLASSITANSNGTVYTINLNHKYRWSNGTPVTSADVVWTTQLLMYSSNTSNSKLPWMNGGAGIGGLPTRWKSVKADGPYKVIVTLNTPSNPAWFIRNGLGQIVPAPKSVWDIHKNMINEMNFIKSVGNSPQLSYYKVVDGPFKYDAALSKPNNQYWTFVPNKSFDGQKASIGKLVYDYFTSSTSEFSSLQKGTINVGYLPFHLYKERSKLTQDKFAAAYPFGFNYFVVNYNSAAPGHFGTLIKNPYARQALQMGIDQAAMIRSFANGLGTPSIGPVPSKPLTPYFDQSLTNAYPYNPSAGKKLLLAHGFKLTNGVMTKNGIPFKFTLMYATGSTLITDEVQLLKQDLAAEGIDVTLEGEPFDSVISNNQSTASKWQALFWGGGWSYEPDYFPTGGGLFATNAGSNTGGYSNSTLDSLIKTTYEPGTGAQIISRMYAYQTFVAKHLPVIFMPEAEQYFENANYVHGVMKNYNPVLNLNWPNSWTITH
ncbi:MAG: ABC transporter substrate-binding protein [Firmicutes bacterium]|jgi:peptide/nickel transport system substrate-binding protein|nr:ABC transporter substrate-binding protein [Bacillota bacterium]MCL5015802.1 ABC transporter substrate-binding protein [Bacillota bacterium]